MRADIRPASVDRRALRTEKTRGFPRRLLSLAYLASKHECTTTNISLPSAVRLSRRTRHQSFICDGAKDGEEEWNRLGETIWLHKFLLGKLLTTSALAWSCFALCHCDCAVVY